MHPMPDSSNQYMPWHEHEISALLLVFYGCPTFHETLHLPTMATRNGVNKLRAGLHLPTSSSTRIATTIYLAMIASKVV